MSTVRPGMPGATRVCPHCKATVLESASVCPGCRHHLRFNASGVQPDMDNTYCALSVDGTIAHQRSAEPCEYCVVLDIRNERGEQIVRQIVGVGALQPGELRRLNVTVDVTPLRPVVMAPAPKPTVKPPTTGPALAPAATTASARPVAAAPTTAPASGTAAANKGMPPGPAGKLPPLQPPPAIKPLPPAGSGRLRLFRKP